MGALSDYDALSPAYPRLTAVLLFSFQRGNDLSVRFSVRFYLLCVISDVLCIHLLICSYFYGKLFSFLSILVMGTSVRMLVHVYPYPRTRTPPLCMRHNGDVDLSNCLPYSPPWRMIVWALTCGFICPWRIVHPHIMHAYRIFGMRTSLLVQYSIITLSMVYLPIHAYLNYRI